MYHFLEVKFQGVFKNEDYGLTLPLAVFGCIIHHVECCLETRHLHNITVTHMLGQKGQPLCL